MARLGAAGSTAPGTQFQRRTRRPERGEGDSTPTRGSPGLGCCLHRIQGPSLGGPFSCSSRAGATLCRSGIGSRGPATLGWAAAQAARALRSPGLGPRPPAEAMRPIRPPPGLADPCPRIPERPRAPSPLTPRPEGLELAAPGPAGLGPALGHGLGPLTPPRGLLACPGGGRGAGKTNRAGVQAWGAEQPGAGRKFAVWPRRRTKPPLREPRHLALTPGPRLRAGRATRGAHARAPGLRRRQSPGSPRVAQAEPAARPKGAKASSAGGSASPRHQSQKSKAEG